LSLYGRPRFPKLRDRGIRGVDNRQQGVVNKTGRSDEKDWKKEPQEQGEEHFEKASFKWKKKRKKKPLPSGKEKGEKKKK